MNRDKDIPLSSVEEFLQRKAAGTLTEKEQSMVDIFEVLGLRELRLCFMNRQRGLDWGLQTHGAQLTRLCLTHLSGISIQSLVNLKEACRQLESLQLHAEHIFLDSPVDDESADEDDDLEEEVNRLLRTSKLDWPSLKLLSFKGRSLHFTVFRIRFFQIWIWIELFSGSG